MLFTLKKTFSWLLSTDSLKKFLYNNKDKLTKKDFTKIALNNNFSPELRELYIDKIDFTELFLNGLINKYNAYKLRDRIDWYYIEKKDRDLYKSFWDYISATIYLDLTETKYHYMINWNIVTTTRMLSRYELSELGNHINWTLMDYKKQPFLTESIIKKYIYKVDLNIIKEKYFFSDSFIEEMMDLQSEVRYKFNH